jgi:hypothetical protein
VTGPPRGSDQAVESQGRRWLHEMTATWNVEQVKRYMEAEEFDVNTPNRHGWTLLLIAVHTHFVPTIVPLIENGAGAKA